jgi:hypothetical protein
MLQELDVLIGFVVVMSIVSLIIMVVTQAISSCLALRGRNLRDALVTLFWQISPNLQNTEELAEKILQDPMFSDSSLSMKGRWPSSWKWSSAIRAEECLEVIHRIANSEYTQSDNSHILHSTHHAKTYAKIKEALLKFIAAQSERKLDKERELHSRTKSAAHKLRESLAEHAADVGLAQLDVERWKQQFNAAQDRAEQWFAMNARWVTVTLGFLAAFLLQLDTFELFTRISSDDTLRNGLLNLSTAVQKRADEAMNQVSPGTVYFAVLKELHNQDSDVKNFAVPQESEAQDYSAAKDWLHKQARQSQPPLDKEKESQLIDRFSAAVQAKSKERLDSAKQEFVGIAGLYAQSKLQLIPDPYWQGWGHFFGVTNGLRHLSGMLATSLLLALGAPFWFNLLKSLTNLRSSVAEKIDKEKQVNPNNTATPPVLDQKTRLSQGNVPPVLSSVPVSTPKAVSKTDGTIGQ